MHKRSEVCPRNPHHMFKLLHITIQSELPLTFILRLILFLHPPPFPVKNSEQIYQLAGIDQKTTQLVQCIILAVKNI